MNGIVLRLVVRARFYSRLSVRYIQAGLSAEAREARRQARWAIDEARQHADMEATR